MKRLTILIDVDEVLADFIGYYIPLVEKALNRKCPIVYPNIWQISKSLDLSEDDLRIVHKELTKKGLASSLTPLPGSIDAVTNLNKNHDLWFVTAPFTINPTWEYDRRQWFKDHFPEGLHKKLIFCESKHKINGDVFIDDKIENIVDWKMHNKNGFPILWEQYYNKSFSATYLEKVKDWDTVFKLIRILEGTKSVMSEVIDLDSKRFHA